jgi:hypothetical protein
MPKLRIIPLTLAAVLFALLLSSGVKASEWDKKTVVTFDQDVQIPGQVLPQGTYVFKLFNSSSNRFVVQVWDESESQLLATLMTVPDYRLDTPNKAYFVLDRSEEEEGYPPALVSWFFPGDNTGRDFIYPSYPTQ